MLASMIRSKTSLEQSPAFGGLDLARSVLDQIVDELKANSTDATAEDSTADEEAVCPAPPTEIKSGNEAP